MPQKISTRLKTAFYPELVARLSFKEALAQINFSYLYRHIEHGSSPLFRLKKVRNSLRNTF